MRRLLSIFVFVAIISCLFAGSKDRLRTHLTDVGKVYYVCNKSLSKCDKTVERFDYDLTYVENRDSVTLNFTVVSQNANEVKSIAISNGEALIEAEQVELIYHEMEKKNYCIRTTSKVPYSQLKAILLDNKPITFIITHSDGEKKSAWYTDSQWKKENEMFKRIFYLIN